MKLIRSLVYLAAFCFWNMFLGVTASRLLWQMYGWLR